MIWTWLTSKNSSEPLIALIVFFKFIMTNNNLIIKSCCSFTSIDPVAAPVGAVIAPAAAAPVANVAAVAAIAAPITASSPVAAPAPVAAPGAPVASVVPGAPAAAAVAPAVLVAALFVVPAPVAPIAAPAPVAAPFAAPAPVAAPAAAGLLTCGRLSGSSFFIPAASQQLLDSSSLLFQYPELLLPLLHLLRGCFVPNRLTEM